ncbi:hypothetical protein Q5O89_16440 [Peribacillus frigoritolerans]|nr:hypothetical protein [Peribacillus frigoritolerans]
MGNSEARLHKRSSGKQKAKLNRSAEAIETRIEKLAKKEKPKEDPPSSLIFQNFHLCIAKGSFALMAVP